MKSTKILLLALAFWGQMTLWAQDDGRYSVTYQYGNEGSTAGSFEDLSTISTANSIGLHRFVRFGPTMISIGLEYNMINTGLGNLVENDKASSIALVLGGRQAFLSENLFYEFNLNFEYDWGVPEHHLYLPYNGIGMQIGLGYDFHINDTYVITPMVGYRGRGLVYFRGRSDTPVSNPWDDPESEEVIRFNRRIGVHFAYKLF